MTSLSRSTVPTPAQPEPHRGWPVELPVAPSHAKPTLVFRRRPRLGHAAMLFGQDPGGRDVARRGPGDDGEWLAHRLDRTRRYRRPAFAELFLALLGPAPTGSSSPSACAASAAP